jgi:hypothetical protein
VECSKSELGRFAYDTCKRNIKYKLYLVGVQEVRWGRGGTEPTGEYALFCKKGMRIMN